jgi:hypothetical protein
VAVYRGPELSYLPRVRWHMHAFLGASPDMKGPKLTILESKLEPLRLSPAEAAKTAGVGSIYEALARGELQARKFGRRTIILNSDLCTWLAALPALKPVKPKKCPALAGRKVISA